MKRQARWTILGLIVVLLAATPGPVPVDSGSAALDTLAERYWQHELQTDVLLRAQVGLPVETLRPVTYANAQADAQFAREVLAELARIDAEKLDRDRWLTSRTLHYLATNDVANETYFWLRQQATPYAGGLQLGTFSTMFEGFKFGSAADAQRYVSLLEQYAVFVRSLGDLLHDQHARHIVLPVAEIDAAQAVFEGYAQPAQAGALVPAESRLSALTPDDRAKLHNDAAIIVTDRVVPAFEDVAAYLKGAYRQGAPTAVGLAQYPGGAAYYRYLVVANTTLTITPEKLHAMGLEGVAQANQKLDGIRSAVGFHGDLAAFKRFLSADKQFYVATPEAFGERLEVYVKRAAEAAPKYFAHMPTAPYGVAPLPKELAGSQTFGYYSQPTSDKPKGEYLYNAWHPERTSTLGAGALICHELIPGHHFQIALQQENAALPNVRRYDFTETGFVEGWGEYASQLCWDMGVYQTPYDRAGRLMQDLMVSARLVVDTGMNAQGWSRERAIAYMRANLTLSDAQIASETLRYSTDIPGQALAYKTGELTLLQIRERARKQLGDAFDIRKFHSWILDSGSMTLDTLQAQVDYEIAKEQQAKHLP